MVTKTVGQFRGKIAKQNMHPHINMHGGSKSKRAQSILEAIRAKQDSAHGRFVSQKVYLERIRKDKLSKDIHFSAGTLREAETIARILTERGYSVKVRLFEVEKGIEIYDIHGSK